MINQLQRHVHVEHIRICYNMFSHFEIHYSNICYGMQCSQCSLQISRLLLFWFCRNRHGAHGRTKARAPCAQCLKQSRLRKCSRNMAQKETDLCICLPVFPCSRNARKVRKDGSWISRCYSSWIQLRADCVQTAYPIALFSSLFWISAKAEARRWPRAPRYCTDITEIVSSNALHLDNDFRVPCH